MRSDGKVKENLEFLLLLFFFCLIFSETKLGYMFLIVRFCGYLLIRGNCGCRVAKESLKPGDHIYSWRTAYIYAHHGSLAFPLVRICFN